MTTLDHLLQAIVSDPLSEDRYLVLADYLEEHDDPRRAELLRLHRRMLATCCEPDSHPERAAWQGRMVELLGLGVRPCVPQRTVVLAEGVEMTFSFVPPGSFLGGIPFVLEVTGDVHERQLVTPLQGFYLGTSLVTQAQWRAAVGRNPSKFKGDDLPVEQISWTDAVKFCKRLRRRVGRHVRLPTEAEWEYAARAGTTTRFFVGDTLAEHQANFGDLRGQTTRAATFPPNAWGLYDMHGNLWEWNTDQDRRPIRLLCGGCWGQSAEDCRFTQRCMTLPDTADCTYGFRLCLDPD